MMGEDFAGGGCWSSGEMNGHVVVIPSPHQVHTCRINPKKAPKDFGRQPSLMTLLPRRLPHADSHRSSLHDGYLILKA